MIRIEVVVINGRLVGRRFSDRWNLEQLGYESLEHSRNGGGNYGIKKFRRMHGEDFAISIVKGDRVPWTEEERNLVSPHGQTVSFLESWNLPDAVNVEYAEHSHSEAA